MTTSQCLDAVRLGRVKSICLFSESHAKEHFRVRSKVDLVVSALHERRINTLIAKDVPGPRSSSDAPFRKKQTTTPISLRHHSRPHAGSLGTTRSSDLRDMICAPTAEQEWLVRRGPGIGSHTGRRVRDGHLKGPGPNWT